MRVTILELEEELMESCEELRPTKEGLGDAIVDVSNMNMLDYWRDMQLFCMSCLAVLKYGDTVPPEQIVSSRYLQQSKDPEIYTLITTKIHFDGQWYEYEYKTSQPIGKPFNDGAIFYNTLDDYTVDKFQIVYEWSETEFLRDSMFLGNISTPSDAGKMLYVFNKNKTVSKYMLSYVFQVDEYVPVNIIQETFVAPADNGAQSCDLKKTVIKRYEFDVDTETWTPQDYVLGYVYGECGYFGYSVIGTATSHSWEIVTSSNNEFHIQNPTMTTDLLADGLIPATATNQKITVHVNESGVFTVTGDYSLGFNTKLVIIAEKNILRFGIEHDAEGGVSMDRNGTMYNSMISRFSYTHTINGTLYRIFSIALDCTAGNIKLVVETNDPSDSSGEIIITI